MSGDLLNAIGMFSLIVIVIVLLLRVMALEKTIRDLGRRPNDG